MMARAGEWEFGISAIEAVRQGDRSAFDDLVRREGSWVRGVVFAVLGNRDRVDDVVQQVWATLWRRIGELRETKLWRTWLYRLARNAAIDAGRELTREAKHGRQAVSAVVREKGSPAADQNVARTETNQVVLAAIAALPGLYREPFVLRHLNGWNYQQIADVLDMPVDSVETRLVRARRMLRDALRGQLE